MNISATIGLIVFAYMTTWFVVSLIAKRNDIADVAWGLGFVLVAWSSYIFSGSKSTLGFAVACLVTIWGIRLAYHIHGRNKGKKEDYRYAAWRKEWGRWFYLRSYMQVYMLQGLFLYIISIPVMLATQHGASLMSGAVFLGFCIWLFGFLFEVIGDAQLATFLKQPSNKGQLMMSGLWKYTRHPNYFGEVVLWWGIWVMSLAAAETFFGIIGPLMITFLILFVSGIPMLEKKMKKHPDFERYRMQTSMFFPLPQKRKE